MLSKAMEDVSTFTMTIVARDERDGEIAIVEESWDVILCNEFTSLVEDLDDASLRPLVVASKDSLESTLVDNVCLCDASDETDLTNLIKFVASKGAMAVIVESFPPDQAIDAAIVPVFYTCKPCTTSSLLGELSVQFARKVDETIMDVDDIAAASEPTVALRQDTFKPDETTDTSSGSGGGDELQDEGKDGNPSSGDHDVKCRNSGEPIMKNTAAASEPTAMLPQDTCSEQIVEMETFYTTRSGGGEELPDGGTDRNPSRSDHDVKVRNSGEPGMKNQDDSKPELQVTVEDGDKEHMLRLTGAGLCTSTSNEENCGDVVNHQDAELEPPHIPPVQREPLVDLSDDGMSAQSLSAGRDKTTLATMDKASTDPLLRVDDSVKSNAAHATSEDASDADLVSFVDTETTW
jgi:hypothetical protein